MDNDDGVVVTQNICYQNRAVLMISLSQKSVLDLLESRRYITV
jgi:hypothetical protein